MDQQDCFELGFITKTHGLKGFVTVFLDTDYPEDYYQLESVFLEQKGELIPFFIEEVKQTNTPQKIQVKFEDIDSIEEATEMIKIKLFLPLEFLPKLEGNKFYYHEVIGFDLTDETSGLNGEVINISETTGQAFFEVSINNRTILVPIQDSFIKKLDRKANSITVILPEGLMEI